MTKDELIQKILREYDEKHSLYTAFTVKQEHLVSEILEEHALSPHSITSRVKKRQSLQDKLKRPDANYSLLGDVSDVSGVRVTTYFSDEVDEVASWLDEEFDVVKDQSVDKRKILDPDRFGYLSLHYVVKLSTQRLKLTEYRRFPQLICEIQIRSILQHAWAEIEHDLGYKSRIAVPRPLRRRFSRLAGLLELADEEFVAIRGALESYKEELPTEIQQSPSEVTLDKLSLTEFLRTNRTIEELDAKIASFFGAKLREPSDLIEHNLKCLNFLGINTISELETVLRKNSSTISDFARIWIGNRKESSIQRGISLLYLWYVITAQSQKMENALAFINAATLGGNSQEIASKIFSTYSLVENK